MHVRNHKSATTASPHFQTKFIVRSYAMLHVVGHIIRQRVNQGITESHHLKSAPLLSKPFSIPILYVETSCI
jgi:hypothetical protein